MIPLLVGAALVGAGLADDAKTYAREAREFKDEADSIINSSKSTLERTHNNMQASLNKLDRTTNSILRGNFKSFVGMMSRISSEVDRSNNPSGIQKLERMGFRKSILNEMKRLNDRADKLSSDGNFYITDGGSFSEMGALVGIGSGMAAFAGANIFLPVAPIALLYGWSNRNEAKESRAKAKTFLEHAKGFRTECNKKIDVMSAIKTRSDQVDDLLYNLDGYYIPAIRDMREVVDGYHGYDIAAYSDLEVSKVFFAYNITEAIRIIIEAPLMQDETTVHRLLASRIEFGNTAIKRLERGGSYESVNQDIKTLIERNR